MKIRLLAILVVIMLQLLSCTGLKHQQQNISFAVTGNSSPNTPFRTDFSHFKDLLNEIRRESPVFTVHTGNIIYGGATKEGLLKSDIENQLLSLKSLLKKNGTIFHIIPGARDSYNEKIDLFLEDLDIPRYHSFNSGSVHFIFLSSKDSDRNFVDTEQLRWLRYDLEENKAASYTVVFTHHRVYSAFRGRATINRAKYLQKLFSRYNVNNVISGSTKRYRKSEKDGVVYIETGCDNATKRKKYSRHNQFYMFTINSNGLSIDPRKFHKKRRRTQNAR